MRRNYPRTDATLKVLTDHVAPVAREMECDYSHINRIKNGEYQDPFAPFRELFRRSSAAHAPVEIWLNELIGIHVRDQRGRVPVGDLSGKILEKIQGDADALQEILKSVADGHLDQSECHQILKRLDANEQTNKQIREIALHRLGEITEAEAKRK